MATVKTYKSARVPAMVAGLLKNAQSIMVNGHIRPDGDSLGSTIALVLALRKLGKKIYGVVSDKSSIERAFVDGQIDISVDAIQAENFADYKAAFAAFDAQK